jgi:hypothetical protein
MILNNATNAARHSDTTAKKKISRTQRPLAALKKRLQPECFERIKVFAIRILGVRILRLKNGVKGTKRCGELPSFYREISANVYL